MMLACIALQFATSPALFSAVADREQNVTVMTFEEPDLELARPEIDPLRLERREDPLITYLARQAPREDFTNLIDGAIRANPALAEAQAGLEEAEAARREARSGLFPTLDIGVSARSSLARNFSNDPDNILERSRSTGRTDATFAFNQTLLDFGNTSLQISAASARINAASFEIERQTDQIALRSIAAWYDVFSNSVLVLLMENYLARQSELKNDVNARIRQGFSAESDSVRVDNLIAATESQLAGSRRALARAEAQYFELFGAPPSPSIRQPPELGRRFASMDAVRSAAFQTVTVSLVEAQARAAREDARAARTQTLPRVSVGLEGGRFGVFENDNDYDVRATINLTHRFFGPADARADQFEARSSAAQARANRIREEAARLAVIAWTDVNALELQLGAAETQYFTSRQSRDVILERFRVSRGSLFEVLEAERDHVNAAISLVSVSTELGAARYVLLSRTGFLLHVLAIEPAAANAYRLYPQ